ncbi:MAG: nucleotide exchange factor GrpE [Candidatus Eisenbacteria bacterium]
MVEEAETKDPSPPETASAPEFADLEGLTKQLDEEKAKAASYLDRWQRAQADFINYKRRVEAQRDEESKLVNAALILRLLPILDDLERAMTSLPSELHSFTWFQGIYFIQRRLQVALEQQGLSPIEALDQDFDPVQHEAVAEEEAEESRTGKVTGELQKGYKFHGRVLRPTLVKVGKARQSL